MSGMEDLTPAQQHVLDEIEARRTEELDPELQPYVEDGEWGPVLRHPLVYAIPLVLPGYANRVLQAKKAALFAAMADEDWDRAVFLHERPYRLRALIDYCIGRYDDEEGTPCPLVDVPMHWGLAADVWVDSENIDQDIEDWRALIPDDTVADLWLGTDAERIAFDALPDPIPAWRGGTVGDWSWTTNEGIAKFFSRRSGIEPRQALIPKEDCFGYLTRRGEYELLVRLTDERRPLVYPEVSGNRP